MSLYNSLPEFMDVCPTELELSETKDEYKCPQENCNSIFKKTSNLKMHLVKHHRIGKLGLLSNSSNARYFCPVEQCMYHIHSTKKRSFTENRLLKQHYMKVHGQKRFECEKCQSKFSVQSIYKRHINSCGIIHVCEVCSWEYNTRDALLIHLLRKHPAVHKLYKQNKSLSEHPQSVRNSSNFFICENRDDIFLKSDSSNKTSLAIIDESKYDTSVNESCDLIFKEAINKITIKNEISSPIICIKSPYLDRVDIDHSSSKHEALTAPIISGSFVVNHSSPDNDAVYSIKVTDPDKKATSVLYVPSYVLVPAVTRFQKIAPRELLTNENITVETQTSPLKTKKGKKAATTRSVVKENKRKQSKFKQTIVKKSNFVADESSASSNQDRCTQTTLKIVKKTNVSVTKKFNVETQTFTSTGALAKPKMKLDKSTNMSFENGKRTFATQTNTNAADDSTAKVFEDIKVSERQIDVTGKKDEIKNINIKIEERKHCNSELTDYDENNIEFLNTRTEAKQFCLDLNVALQHEAKDNKPITNKNQNASESVFRPCLDEMNQVCDEKSNNCFSDTTPLNFDPSDINSQYVYRDLIDEKCAGSSTTIETQTALDELLYSNRWRHDSILFSPLVCLSDIQTQTAWPTDSNNLESDMNFDNCLSAEMDSLSDPVKYPDCENVLISTETQTNENIFGFPSKISSFEDSRNESPDFSFKETQTCECFMDSMNFSDYDFGNLASSSFATANTHAKNCCRVLLSRKSDVLLSCASSETQTYLKDQSANKNLTSDSP